MVFLCFQGYRKRPVACNGSIIRQQDYTKTDNDGLTRFAFVDSFLHLPICIISK